jgi:hypothetical protein
MRQSLWILAEHEHRQDKDEETKGATVEDKLVVLSPASSVGSEDILRETAEICLQI